MPLNPDEEQLIHDIECLQAATRKVLRGLGGAPPDLQDNIATALAQWVSTMGTVTKAIRTEAELRPEVKKLAPGENN